MSGGVETSLTVRERCEEAKTNNKRFLHVGWNDNDVCYGLRRTTARARLEICAKTDRGALVRGT